MNTSKITRVEFVNSWDNARGEQMFTHRVAFADGIEGTANAKTTPPWYAVGDEVAYIVQRANGRESRLRIQKAEYATAEGKQAPQTAPNRAAAPAADDARVRWAISTAVEFAPSAFKPLDPATFDTIKDTAAQFLRMADELKTSAR